MANAGKSPEVNPRANIIKPRRWVQAVEPQRAAATHIAIMGEMRATTAPTIAAMLRGITATTVSSLSTPPDFSYVRDRTPPSTT
jgi:hypothetical protein